MKLFDSLLSDLDARGPKLDRYANAYAGNNRAVFLSADARKALSGKIDRLGVNFPRLVIGSMADRLRVDGFGGSDGARAWQDWTRVGLVALSELVHTDRLLYGSAFVTVWADDAGNPYVTGDNPRTMIVDSDPGTGEPLAALRRWTTREETHAVLFTPEAVTRYRAPGGYAPPGGGWKVTSQMPNPFGVLPVVPFVRAGHLGDTAGLSAVADVLDLTDAYAKVLSDAMVTSEHFARPRRWATGLEIEEDDDGNPIDPFSDRRFLQNEDPAGKFGQFQSADLDGYTDLLATLTQNVGALTGLPPHYLGLHGDQPPSAESVRAAEAQLTSRAFSEQRHMSGPWERVGGLLLAVGEGLDPRSYDLRTSWQSPEVRTPAQAADAAGKLAGIGVPLAFLMSEVLDYDPEKVQQAVSAARVDRVLNAAQGVTL